MLVQPGRPFVLRPFHERVFLFRRLITAGILAPFDAAKDCSHPLPRLDHVKSAMHANSGAIANPAKPLRFFAHHVDLLATHRSSIRFQDARK